MYAWTSRKSRNSKWFKMQQSTLVLDAFRPAICSSVLSNVNSISLNWGRLKSCLQQVWYWLFIPCTQNPTSKWPNSPLSSGWIIWKQLICHLVITFYSSSNRSKRTIKKEETNTRTLQENVILLNQNVKAFHK